MTDATLPLQEGRSRERPPGGLRALVERVGLLRRRSMDRSGMHHAAGGAFLIRIGSAAIAFLSQPLLARLMGNEEFGIYAYVWTWAVLLGGIVDCGLSTAAQRFIPEYRGTGALALLAGFITGSRWLATGAATLIAGLAALAIGALGEHLDPNVAIPMYIGCATLPFCALCVTQDGIARSYNWIGLALLPLYVVRPLAILALLLVIHFAGYPANAVSIMAATVVASVVTTLGQTLVLNGRLRGAAARPRAYDFRRWAVTSVPISLSTALFYLLSYIDVLVLQAFRPPGEIAVYYAVQKLLALVAFVHFSVAAAVAYRYSEYRATGQIQRLAAFHATSRRWTLLPSLGGLVVLLIAGWPLLWLFGPEFVAGYPLILILAAGLLARAAAGPAERLLTMLGRQGACVLVYLAAVLCDLLACFLLIPRFGSAGAAVSTSLALLAESAAFMLLTRHALAKEAAVPHAFRQS
jgi:O-antigen/teichoic acid export membrane protein